MAWRLQEKAPGPGFVLAVLRENDDLAKLAAEVARSSDPVRVALAADTITAANGITTRSANGCAWSRDISAWVLGTGGIRMPFDDDRPNKCEGGLGFAAFRSGQRIWLPRGVRPEAPTVSTPAAVGVGVGGLVAVAAIAWLLFR